MEAELNNKRSLYIAMWPRGTFAALASAPLIHSLSAGTPEHTKPRPHLFISVLKKRCPQTSHLLTDRLGPDNRRAAEPQQQSVAAADDSAADDSEQWFLEEQAEPLVLEELQWWMHYSHSAQLVALILYSLYLWNIDQPYFNGHLSCRADRKCSLARLTANTRFLSFLLLASTQSAHF